MGKPTERRGRVAIRGPIHEQILPHIRRDIVLNRWAPGERLPESDLCSEFGVSRTPMRDVLKILEVEGLITLVPNAGAVITPISPPDLSEKLEVLMSLEQTAARRAAERQSPSAIAEIRRLHEEMIAAARDGLASRYYSLNDEFHRALVTGAANLTLAKMHATIMSHVSRARNRANAREALTQEAAEHHAAIVDAVLRGDGAAAESALRLHLEDVTANIMACFSAGVVRASA